MPIKELPVFEGYDLQRFRQYSPRDVANWYTVEAPTGKKKGALYPAMGRRHIEFNDVNVLEFDAQPRKIFKSIDFVYVIVGSSVYRVNKQFSSVLVAGSEVFTRVSGTLNFAYLPTITIPGGGSPPVVQNVFCMLCDGEDIFVIDETTNTMTVVSDPLRPPKPLCVAAFGNRFVVSTRNSTQFQLSQTNLGGTYNPATCFTIAGSAVFAQESGLIRQMAVLQNQLFIFTDYTTGKWSNTPSLFENASFPWRKNTSFEMNFGIADPDSIDTDFGMMCWLGQNRNGLVTFMTSNGDSPTSIANQAVNVLIQSVANSATLQPLLTLDTVGFLYQYENMVFYRVSLGPYIDYQSLDRASYATCLEYSFATQTWHRCVELNGQRNRIEQHEFFNNKHLVSVSGENTIYQMAGNIYFNELRNPVEPDVQSDFAYLAYPMRYEMVTPIVSEPDYSEFITDYIEIDFVYGDSTYISWDNGFANTVFIISELPAPDGSPEYIIAQDGITYIVVEGTATPALNESIYYDLFKPHIELFVSDDGGMSFFSADVLEFSQLGIYQWRMRWYQGGPSRNRVYKLVAASAAPIVVLGAVQNIRRASGGAN